MRNYYYFFNIFYIKMINDYITIDNNEKLNKKLNLILEKIEKIEINIEKIEKNCEKMNYIEESINKIHDFILTHLNKFKLFNLFPNLYSEVLY